MKIHFPFLSTLLFSIVLQLFLLPVFAQSNKAEFPTRFKVAAARLAPVFMNREKTLEKACNAIAEASAQGAKLVVFHFSVAGDDKINNP
ncbi:hypothetical protein SLH46_14610 [Draconibacterium sp. IB214405]|uniref:hypothetical protein n=1 Tax=Draconibacterium sp. IB214405 TaxID=3097352 RepID=UPI002A1463DA|nr:hypothetical protein [Draconibacterium sp. IB214405]MDX8340431.1 hypothetical protein [Draconibacterium sp. IB214405]